MEGQEARARLIHAQAVAAADQLHEQIGKELDEYSSLHAAYGDDPKNSAALENAYRLAAQKFGDNRMKTALETDHIAGANRILQWLDAKHSDLGVTNAQREKQAAQRALEAPWEANPTDDAGVPITAPPPEVLDPSVGDPALQPQQDKDAPSAGIIHDPIPNPHQEPPTGDQSQADQRGPQTAQAGASDAPELGATKTPDWQEPPSQALAQAKAAGKRNTPAINQLARKMASGVLRPQDYKGVPNDVLAFANARRLEIENELNSIQSNKDLTGQAAYNAIHKVDPEFADALKGYVNGDFPVPSGVRNLPMLQRIIGLGQKMDPYFNAATYQNRNAAVKQWTSGVNGRNLVSQLTSLDHIAYLKQLASQIPYQHGLGPMLNRWIQEGIAQGPQSEWFQAATKARDALNLYNSEVALIAPEVARAQKGAAPTQAEERAVIDGLTGKDPESIQHNIDGAETLIRHRLGENAAQFKAAMGGHPVQDYEKLFSNFERKGISFTEGDPGPGLRSGRSYSDEFRYQMQQPYTPPSQTGAGPQQAPQQQSGGQSDDDQARTWAKAHPDDPRSKKILEGLQ
ncbi:MAG TPA: hypothetical protein VHT52_19210 [Stellaceae bacterium]|nr:hypothetical protein [Stellaceae bacterium]